VKEGKGIERKMLGGKNFGGGIVVLCWEWTVIKRTENGEK
jgi:hypothetical protein